MYALLYTDFACAEDCCGPGEKCMHSALWLAKLGEEASTPNFAGVEPRDVRITFLGTFTGPADVTALFGKAVDQDGALVLDSSYQLEEVRRILAACRS